jgi:transposase
MMILAIDLGMSNSVYCTLNKTTGQHAFGSVRTYSEPLRKLLERLRPRLVVVESGSMAALVHDLATELNLPILVADTTQDAWCWRNVKRKTDRDDALKLANLAALGQINPVHVPSREVRQWRQLIELRRSVIQERSRCKCRIRDLLRRNAEETLKRGAGGWTQSERRRIEAFNKPLADCGLDELWRGALDMHLRHLKHLEEQVVEVEARLDRIGRRDARTVRLQSLPGVGPRVAETLVAILDDPHRFSRGRQVGAYAGLTPKQYDSGQTKRSGRISKRGSRPLRHALNQAAWRAVACDPHFRAIFTRVCRGSKKRRKIAIVAVMRRLLIVAWAMLRDETPYQRPAAVQQAA